MSQQQKLENRLERSSVVIAVHEFVALGGPGQDLRKYFLQHKVNKVLYISHPLLYVDKKINKNSKCEIYRRGKKKKSISISYLSWPEPFLLIKDLIMTFWWGLKYANKSDLFIGIDPLNAFAGLLLKFSRRVDRVVYYSIDYFPVRYENNIMNSFYHFADRICVRFSDETWNVGSYMKKARQEYYGLSGEKYNRQYYLPIGIWANRFSELSKIKKSENTIVYAGHLIDYMGVELPLRALSLIHNKMPSARLAYIGRGDMDKKLHKLSKELSIEKSVTFIPWIGDRLEFERRLAACTVGLAPFNTKILDDKIRNADPGKIKDYMLAGLPVITTKALVNYKDIQKNQVGIVIDYEANQLAKAVVRLLTNNKSLHKYRANVSKYVLQFDWNILFTKRLLSIWKIK